MLWLWMMKGSHTMVDSGPRHWIWQSPQEDTQPSWRFDFSYMSPWSDLIMRRNEHLVLTPKCMAMETNLYSARTPSCVKGSSDFVLPLWLHLINDTGLHYEGRCRDTTACLLPPSRHRQVKNLLLKVQKSSKLFKTWQEHVCAWAY